MNPTSRLAYAIAPILGSGTMGAVHPVLAPSNMPGVPISIDDYVH